MLRRVAALARWRPRSVPISSNDEDLDELMYLNLVEEKMNESLDLADVDPLKWAEVRRRVAVIRDYLMIPHPTGADRDRHASQLGLGTAQFYNLVRAWRAHRKPSALIPGIRDVARPSKSRRGGVDPRAREIARNVIYEFGRTATVTALATEITRRCALEQVTPPSRGTIYALARERGHSPDASPAEGILVARAFMRLPTMIDGNVTFPTSLLAVEIPNGRILGIVLTEEVNSDEVSRLVPTLRERLLQADLPITAAEADIDSLEQALPGARYNRATSQTVARLLASTVGRRIGYIELRTSHPTASTAAVMQSARDEALSKADAETALEIARQHHNRSRLEPTA